MKMKIKGMGDQQEFLKRINKTLYYGQLPTLACLSLPVTEVSCSVWSECQRGRSVRRLRPEQAARLARGASVSPTALVLALLYMERLHAHNQTYLAQAEPAHLFLVSLMVGNKFLEDNGEDDEVLISEWADSSGLGVEQLRRLEIQFLQAIEWNVFVSEESFEEKLKWLEKEVALRQARGRGFYTYSDLRVLSGQLPAAALSDMLSGVSAATVALVLGYSAALVTLLASALLLAPLQPAPRNTTLRGETFVSEDVISSAKVMCCTKWLNYNDGATPPTDERWRDAVGDRKPYGSSLIDPVQRWLEEVGDHLGGRLHLTELGVLAVSVSDR